MKDPKTMTQEEYNVYWKDRLESEARTCCRITNADLICKDCAYVLPDDVILGNTSGCKRYSWKPSSIVGGGSCPYYTKG